VNPLIAKDPQDRIISMNKKYVIVFIVCLLVLAFSEYLFLVEFSSQKRLPILTATTVVAIVSLVAIFFSYRRMGKEV
jgi:hypothetical protein